MNIEIGRHVKLKLATAGIGAAFLLSSLGNVTKETLIDKNITEPKNKPSEHLIPVPCAGESIVLASVKRPEPTPNRNQPECWTIIRDSVTTFPSEQ